MARLRHRRPCDDARLQLRGQGGSRGKVHAPPALALQAGAHCAPWGRHAPGPGGQWTTNRGGQINQRRPAWPSWARALAHLR
jgi:hypothetical protein